MADPRNELQGSFQPPRIFQSYGELILALQIKGFRNHVDTKIQIESPVTAFCGVNGSGKSTILQLAATAYQVPANGPRYYVSTFILTGEIGNKPFTDAATVEITYAQPLSTQGQPTSRVLTVSRSGGSWNGYANQPERSVFYLGSGFHLPHAERDELIKKAYEESSVDGREALAATVLEKISRILICKYEEAFENLLKTKSASSQMRILTAKRTNGVEYSEANMGSGEARLYSLIMRIESSPDKSLILIEEPETALHPSAQYELGVYLVEVAKRKSLQILLTTHSEYLMLAMPQQSRIYLKREGQGIVPIPRVGVRQAVSMMDNLQIPAIYILVEDDVAEAIVTELLRAGDADFQKTVRIVVAGDKDRIRTLMGVFHDQNLPVCGVRDGDVGQDKKLKIYKLFGTEAPEKEIFASASFRKTFSEELHVNWDPVDIENKGKEHHRWFDPLVLRMGRKRSEILSLTANAYLKGILETDRKALVDQIKTAVP